MSRSRDKLLHRSAEAMESSSTCVSKPRVPHSTPAPERRPPTHGNSSDGHYRTGHSNAGSTSTASSSGVAPKGAGLRERLLVEGCTHLGDIELLAIVLGTGTFGTTATELSAFLYDKGPGLNGIALTSARDLASFHGVGEAKATRILAALELGKRYGEARAARETEVVSGHDDVRRWAMPILACLAHEELWLLCLDSLNRVLWRGRIAQGGVHGCALTARDILRPALRYGASRIVVVHNHPSGEPSPSPTDVEMTRVLQNAARVVGLELVDHVVVARKGSSSLLELGVLDS